MGGISRSQGWTGGWLVPRRWLLRLLRKEEKRVEEVVFLPWVGDG